MQITNLSLSNLNLYSPSTGEVICHEETGYHHGAKTLMGYWIYEVVDQPFIKDDRLKEAWEKFVARFEEENDDFPAEVEIDDFFVKYEQQSWFVFKIQTFGMAGDIA